MLENVYGYIRISDADEEELKTVMWKQEVPAKHIYMDSQNGKEQYQKLIKILKRGDLLYLVDIRHLGNSAWEIREQWDVLTKKIGTDIAVLDMPQLNTRKEKLDQEISPIDLAVKILDNMEQNTRKNRKKRQAEGIAAARKRGVRFGRPAKPIPDNFGSIITLWDMGRLPFTDVLQLCGMSEATFYRRLREYRKRKNTEQGRTIETSVDGAANQVRNRESR